MARDRDTPIPTDELTERSLLDRLEKDGRLRRAVARQAASAEHQEDLVQEARIAMVRARRSFDPIYGVPVRAHVVLRGTFAIRSAGRKHRRRRSEEPRDDETVFDAVRDVFRGSAGANSEDTPETVAGDREIRAVIFRAIGELDARHRRCVVGWLREEPWSRIAAELGYSEHYCQELKSDALRRLRAPLLVLLEER